MDFLTPEQVTTVRSEVDKATAKFIQELPYLVKTKLEGAVARILGFENRFGGEWTVDHCNGRVSDVGTLIDDKAKAAALGALTGLDWKPTQELIQAVRQDFASKVAGFIRENLNRIARDHAHELIRSVVESGRVDAGAPIKIPPAKDLYSPHGVFTDLQQIIIEDIIKKEQKAES